MGLSTLCPRFVTIMLMVDAQKISLLCSKGITVMRHGAYIPNTRLYFTTSTVQTVSYKEARNSFLGLGVYLLKSKFRIEDRLRFP